AVAWPPFPLGEALPSTVSAKGEPSLFDASQVLRPRLNPHPRACSSSAFSLHEPVRHAAPDTDEASQVPYKGGWLSLTSRKTCTSYPLPACLAHSQMGHEPRIRAACNSSGSSQ